MTSELEVVGLPGGKEGEEGCGEAEQGRVWKGTEKVREMKFGLRGRGLWMSARTGVASFHWEPFKVDEQETDMTGQALGVT